MINLEISPRRTGKTTRLVEKIRSDFMKKENDPNAIFFVFSFNHKQKENIKKRFNENAIYSADTLARVSNRIKFYNANNDYAIESISSFFRGKEKNFDIFVYFDEFAFFRYSSFKNIIKNIELSKLTSRVPSAKINYNFFTTPNKKYKLVDLYNKNNQDPMLYVLRELSFQQETPIHKTKYQTHLICNRNEEFYKESLYNDQYEEIEVKVNFIEIPEREELINFCSQFSQKDFLNLSYDKLIDLYVQINLNAIEIIEKI